MAPFLPAAPTLGRARRRTHTAPQIPVLRKGGGAGGEVGAKAVQTMERKSESEERRGSRAAGRRERRGPGMGLDCPGRGRETPTSSGAVGGPRDSPLIPCFVFPSLPPPLDCFFSTFSSPGLTRFCPRSPPSPPLPCADLRGPVTFPSPSGSYPHQAFHNDTSRKVGRFKSTMKWSLFNPVLSSLGKCSNTVRFQRALLMRRACQVHQLQPPRTERRGRKARGVGSGGRERGRRVWEGQVTSGKFRELTPS